ncbi:MAG: site-2 protease family protein [Minisyncoccia bacterium]|jgi:Zn-dependent protease
MVSWSPSGFKPPKLFMLFIILSIVILIFSVILHEVSHGYMAEALGDPTARLSGRLSLNPLKHIDPIGSIIVPLVTSLMGFTFGWAKPVPYNPYNLKNRRIGEPLIAIAGPASNLAIALVFGTILRFISYGITDAASAVAIAPFITIISYIVVINIVLAVFNLIPLPPLDGSKLLFAALPTQYGRVRYVLESYAPVFVLIVVFFLWQILSPVIPWVFRLFTGINF